MGRLTRVERSNRTKQANSPQNLDKNLKPFSHEDELEFITEAKQVILDHPAKTKALIGAKDTGKNRMINVRICRLAKENKHAHFIGLRKYKTSVKTRIGNAVRNMALEIRAKGYNVYEVESGQQGSFFVKDKFNRNKNQTMEYGGFDDVNGIAGIEAPNLGYFPIVEIDEPVLAMDPGKIPSEDEWRESMAMSGDSVDRSNRRHAQVNNIEVPMTQWYLAMNPWDDHPEVIEAEEAFPEQEFLDWVLLDPIKNNLKARYDSEKDKLFVRMTKFSNPTLDHKALLEEVEKAIEDNNKFELTRLLGLKNESESTDPKAYRLNNLITGNTEEMLKGKHILGNSIGWDIDINRQLVMTPITVAGDKETIFHEVSNVKVYAREQIPLPAYGKGAERIKRYVESIEEQSIKTRNDLLKDNNYNPYEFGFYMYVDEDKSEWTWSMDKLRQYVQPASAKKHGKWDIIHRQENVQLGIDAGVYVIDEKNTKLIANLRKATRKEGSTKRDESSTKEKNYDEINSYEYALYPWRGIMFSQNTKGDK